MDQTADHRFRVFSDYFYDGSAVSQCTVKLEIPIKFAMGGSTTTVQAILDRYSAGLLPLL